jgi:aspartate beta-hydroxylase
MVLRRLYCRINSPPVMRQQAFDGVDAFEARWEELAKEAEAIFSRPSQVPTFGQILPEQEELASADGSPWRLYIAKAYNYRVPSATRVAPVLSGLAEATGVLSAAYSWMPAGKVVPEHRGPFRGVLRCTLPLIVSEPLNEELARSATLTVDGREIVLQRGIAIVWDDTFPHSVKNETMHPRIVLLLDVRRLDLPWHLRSVSALVIAVARLAAVTTLREHGQAI